MSELTDAFGRTVDSIGKSMDEMRTLLRQMLSNKDDLKTQKVAEEGNKSLEDLVDKLDDLTKSSEETIKVLKDVGDNMVKAIVDTRTGKSTPVTGKANVASKKDPTAATQDALGGKDAVKDMAEIEKSLKSITTMHSQLAKESAFAGMSLAITNVIRKFDMFSMTFDGVMTQEMNYTRDLRAIAFETQGITAQTRGLQDAYQATGKVVAEIGMNLTDFQKTYTKNLKGGVRSQKEMLTVTKASLSTATMIGSNAESTNDLFAKWHMQMGLTSNQASQLGRDVQTVARWTGVTGDNLLKVVQSSEKFVKSMRDAGTLTSQSAKNVMGLMAEAEKSGIGDQMERIVGAASNTYELFMKSGKETQSLMFAAASQVGKVNELRQGTLFQTRDGIKATADGMKNLMTQMGWVEDAASKLGGEELAQLNLRLQSAFGLQAGEVDRLIKSLDDGSKGYAERISDINKKLKEQNLTAEERLNLEKQGKKLAEDKGFEFLNAVEEAAKGAKSMDEAINKTFAKNKDMASDLGAMGVNLKSNMSAMQGAAMLSAKSIKEAGGKDFTKDIQKALSSGDMGKMREVIQAMHAESRKANVDQKKSLDPMSKMDQTLDLINESIRGFTGPMVRYFAGAAIKAAYLGATLASAYNVLRSIEVGMKVISDHFAKEDGVKGMDDPAAGSGGIKGFIGSLLGFGKDKAAAPPGEPPAPPNGRIEDKMVNGVDQVKKSVIGFFAPLTTGFIKAREEGKGFLGAVGKGFKEQYTSVKDKLSKGIEVPKVAEVGEPVKVAEKEAAAAASPEVEAVTGKGEIRDAIVNGFDKAKKSVIGFFTPLTTGFIKAREEGKGFLGAVGSGFKEQYMSITKGGLFKDKGATVKEGADTAKAEKAIAGGSMFSRMADGFKKRFGEMFGEDSMFTKVKDGFKKRFGEMFGAKVPKAEEAAAGAEDAKAGGLFSKILKGVQDKYKLITKDKADTTVEGAKTETTKAESIFYKLGKTVGKFLPKKTPVEAAEGAVAAEGAKTEKAESIFFKLGKTVGKFMPKTQAPVEAAEEGAEDAAKDVKHDKKMLGELIDVTGTKLKTALTPIGDKLKTSVSDGLKKLRTKFVGTSDKKGFLGMMKESLTKLKTKVLPKTMEAAEAPTPDAGGGAVAEPKVPEIPSMKDMAKMGPSMLKIAAAVAIVGAAMLVLVKIVGALGIDSGQVIETTKTIGAILVGAALIIAAAGVAALAMKEVGKHVDTIKKAVPDIIKGAVVMAILAPVMVLFAAGLIYFIDAMLGAMGVDAGKAEEVAGNVAGILMSAGKILVATALAALVLVGVGTIASMLWGPQGAIFLGLMAAGAAALLVLAPVMVLLAASVVKFCDLVMSAVGVDAAKAAQVADEVSSILGSAASILWTTAKSAAMFLALGVAMALCIGPQGLILLRLMSLGAVALMILAPTMAGLSSAVVKFCDLVMGAIGIDAGKAAEVADNISGILGSAGSILWTTAKSAAMFLALGTAMALCIGPQGLILLKLMSLGAVALMVLAPVMTFLSAAVVKFCMNVMGSMGIDGATAKQTATDVEDILVSAYEIMKSVGKTAAMFLGVGAVAYMMIGPQALILGGLMLLGAASLMLLGPTVAKLAAGIAMMVVSVLRSNIPKPSVIGVAAQVLEDIGSMVQVLGETIGTLTQVLLPMVSGPWWTFWLGSSPLDKLQAALPGLRVGLGTIFDFLGDTGDDSIISQLKQNFPNPQNVKVAAYLMQDVAWMVAAVSDAIQTATEQLVPLSKATWASWWAGGTPFAKLEAAMPGLKAGLKTIFEFLGETKGDSIIALLKTNFPNPQNARVAAQLMQDVAWMAASVADAIQTATEQLVPLSTPTWASWWAGGTPFKKLETAMPGLKAGLKTIFEFLGETKGDSIIAMLRANFPNPQNARVAAQLMMDVATMADGVATAIEIATNRLIPLSTPTWASWWAGGTPFKKLETAMPGLKAGLKTIFEFLGDKGNDSIIGMLKTNFPNPENAMVAARLMQAVGWMMEGISDSLTSVTAMLESVREPSWYEFWKDDSPFKKLEQMQEPMKTGFGQLITFLNESILGPLNQLPDVKKIYDAANKLSAVADAMLNMSAALQAMGDAAKGFKNKKVASLSGGGFWSTITGLFGFGGGSSGADIGKGLLNPSSAEKAQASIDDARKKTEVTGEKIKDSLYKKGVQAQAQDVNNSAKQTQGVVGDNMSGATEALQSSLEEFNGGIDKSVDDVKSSLERAKNKVSGMEAAAAAGGAAGGAAGAMASGNQWDKPGGNQWVGGNKMAGAAAASNIPTYKSDLQESEATLAQREKDKVSFRDALQFSGNETPAAYGGGGGMGGGNRWDQPGNTRWGMAKGGSFVAKQATPLTVGEKGLERVTVTPGNNIPDLETKTASMAEAAANKAAMTIPAARAGGIQSSPLSDAYDRMGQQQAGAEAGTQQIKSDELVSIDNATNKQVEHLGDIHETLQDIKRLLTPNLGSMSGASPTPLAGSTAPQTSSFGSTDYGKWQFGRHGGNANSQVLNDGTS